MTCDHVTGQYICRSGYLGLTCEHPCPPDRYGNNCANHCDCKNDGECHHVTGKFILSMCMYVDECRYKPTDVKNKETMRFPNFHLILYLK